MLADTLAALFLDMMEDAKSHFQEAQRPTSKISSKQPNKTTLERLHIETYLIQSAEPQK